MVINIFFDRGKCFVSARKSIKNRNSIDNPATNPNKTALRINALNIVVLRKSINGENSIFTLKVR